MWRTWWVLGVLWVIVLVVWNGLGVLVGQQQIHLPLKACKICLNFVDLMAHLLETPSDVIVEQSLSFI